jgi:hypothetical protein
MKFIINLSLLLLIIGNSTFAGFAYFKCSSPRCNSSSENSYKNKLTEEFKTLQNIPLIILDFSNTLTNPINSLTAFTSTKQNINAGNPICSMDITEYLNKKKYAKCLANSLSSKIIGILSLLFNLNNQMYKLLNSMSQTPVCSLPAYTWDKFAKEHNISPNIDNIKNILFDLQNVLDQLKNLTDPNCSVCADPNAINDLISTLDSLINQLNFLQTQLTIQLLNICNKLLNFSSDIKLIIASHSTDPDIIQAECKIRRQVARNQSRKRLAVIKAFKRFDSIMRSVISKINRLNNRNNCTLNKNPKTVILQCF